jgi:hypothetical protein
LLHRVATAAQFNLLGKSYDQTEAARKGATATSAAYFVRATVVPSHASPSGFSSCCRQRSIIAKEAAS